MPTENPCSDSRASPTVARPTANHVTGHPVVQQHGAEHRGEHDVGAGDEARHRCVGVLQAGGLQHLRDPVERAQHHPDPQLAPAEREGRRRNSTNMTTAAMPNRTARKSAGGTCSTRSWIRKNVEPQTAVTGRAGAWQPGVPGLPAAVTAGQTIVRVMVLPLGALLPPEGSCSRTVPKNPPSARRR